ncbi:MAG: MFS transporter [Halioglobus sp.]|nr:MFS transporter [Halioglobus sp.]
MNPQERRAVGGLALLYCFRMLGLFMVLPLLALYAADLPGATPSQIGLALGIYGLAQAALQVPLGWLSDRVGRKPVIVGGLVVFALGSVVAALSDSVQGIILGRALQGAGAIASALMAMVADLTRDEQRTKAMAVVGVSIGASFSLALILGPLVAAVGGLPAVFWFSALLSLVGITVILRLVPVPPVAAVAPRAGSLVATCSDPLLWRLNFGVFVLHFILTACFLVVPGLLEHSLGIRRQLHWMVYLPVLLLSVAGMLPLMRLAERYGRLRLAFLIAIGGLTAALAALEILSISPAVYIALWLFFVGFNYLEATLPSLLSKSVTVDNKGAAMGVYASCQFLGAFAGGAGGGWLLQHAGAALLIAACLLLTAVWWLLVLRAPLCDNARDMRPGMLTGV